MRRKKVCKTDLDEKTLRELETRSNLNAFIITEGKISRMAIGQKRGLAEARIIIKVAKGGQDGRGARYLYTAKGLRILEEELK